MRRKSFTCALGRAIRCVSRYSESVRRCVGLTMEAKERVDRLPLDIGGLVVISL